MHHLRTHVETHHYCTMIARETYNNKHLAPLHHLHATIVFIHHAAETTIATPLAFARLAYTVPATRRNRPRTTTHGLHLHHHGSVHGSTMLEREVTNALMVAPTFTNAKLRSSILQWQHHHHCCSGMQTYHHLSATIANPSPLAVP